MEGLGRFSGYEKLACELVEYQARVHLSGEAMLLRNLEVRSHFDRMTQSLVLELRSMAASRERVETEEMKLPDGWWEAFKERWFPGWALKRWPVKWKRFVVTTRVYHCCPHLDVRANGPHLEFLRQVDRVGG